LGLALYYRAAGMFSPSMKIRNQMLCHSEEAKRPKNLVKRSFALLRMTG
jgi:hypothetical protein